MFVHIDGIVDITTLDFTNRHYKRQGQLAYIDLDYAYIGGKLVLQYEEDGAVLISGSQIVRIDEDETVFNITTENNIYHFSKREEVK